MIEFQHTQLDLATGINIHVVVAGLTSFSGQKLNCGNKLCVLFVHGFPEMWRSWKAQMEAVANAGYIAIAPDLRGYNLTSSPPDVEAYHMRQLTGDLNCLLDELGVSKAVFVGHDWGGMVVWSHVLHYPHRCLGVVGVNTPLGYWDDTIVAAERNGYEGPIAYLASLPPEECKHLDYNVYFQEPDLPEAELENNIVLTLAAYFRNQSSGDKNLDYGNAKVGMRCHNARKPCPGKRMRGVLHYCPADLKRDPCWSDNEFKEYVEAFTRSGFRGPVNWYRNVDANYLWDKQCGITIDTKVNVPTLMITATNDGVLRPKDSYRMDTRCTKLSRAQIDCGHWTQIEAPEKLNTHLLTWLNKTYSQSSL